MSRKKPVDIGSRVEMFVDDWIMDEMDQVCLQLNHPQKKEIVMTFEQPWEGPHSSYFSVFQDEQKIRMYYRGNTSSDLSQEQVTCYAESSDGIHFTKPELGLVSFAGSTKNNIVLQGLVSHNFAPFYDRSPHAPSSQKYKALGGVGESHQVGRNRSPLHALCSEDAIHWHLLQDDPIMTDGAFDSHNIAFWDNQIEAYRCYNRYFTEHSIRGVQSTLSRDFIHWEPQQKNEYHSDIPLEHFYTNATIPCPGAEHMYLSFPMRFVPNRKKIVEHHENGLSDAVFMTSRDGVFWDRTFMEAWVRPGLDPRNWTDRNSLVAHGCVETGEHECSFYIMEHYRWPDLRLRRLTVRKHGFASVHADYDGGQFITRPIRFTGQQLLLNYSTSAVGFVQVEVADEEGLAIEGLAFDDMDPLFGDEIEGKAQWKSGKQLSELGNRLVRLRFRLKDADLYAFRVL